MFNWFKKKEDIELKITSDNKKDKEIQLKNKKIKEKVETCPNCGDVDDTPKLPLEERTEGFSLKIVDLYMCECNKCDTTWEVRVRR